MKILKNVLMLLGIFFVITTLIFAVQQTADITTPDIQDVAEIDANKSVSDTYRITAIDIPSDLNFASEIVPQDDPEIMERVDREFLVNTYWQSNALLLMKRANKYFPIIEPI